MESSSARHSIAFDVIGKVRVSTIDMAKFGIPLAYIGYRYETMVFGGQLDGTQERAKEEWEALLNHRWLVVKVKAAKKEQ